MSDARTLIAVELMTRFADRTGLTAHRRARRYLWTDAFAVCNFLGLARRTGDAAYEELAVRLVDRVHDELGRHRADDARTGWLSGLPDGEGEAHPTRGGLRIGKPMPERSPSEPEDPDGEWDRDGQYFHYLTKWMHALDRVAFATGSATFDAWAFELADVAHRAFTYEEPAHERRMVWKLSVDLSRPLVSSMGHHDPLDGLVTCLELGASATASRRGARPSLALAAADFATMIDPTALATSDPLGIGGLLTDACRLAQIDARPELVSALLAASVLGLRRYRAASERRAPATQRLAFRELGLAIGLAGISVVGRERIAEKLDAGGRTSLAQVCQYVPLRDEIETFWLRPEHRGSWSWGEHADINDVMLATSLAPEGYLVIGETHPSIAAPDRPRRPAAAP